MIGIDENTIKELYEQLRETRGERDALIAAHDKELFELHEKIMWLKNREDDMETELARWRWLEEHATPKILLHLATRMSVLWSLVDAIDEVWLESIKEEKGNETTAS